MTLLHLSSLFAAVGILVPIAIHLHRKRRARVVAWPAMQFLTQTLASRRRGLSVENLLLLFVRCSVILLFALAMAQPLLPDGRSLSVVGSLLLLTGGIFGITLAVIRFFARRTRMVGLATGIVLLTAAAATLRSSPQNFSSPTEHCDLVIVLDETSSMLMTERQAQDASSPFARAVDEAISLVGQLSGSSTVAIVRCGPVVETLEGGPFRDLSAAEKRLAELRPTGGGANTSEALDQAVALAQKGPNSLKQVVLFTDTQLSVWESLEQSRWLSSTTVDHDPARAQNAAQTTTQTEPKPETDERVPLAVQLARLPDQAANISVSDIRVDSPVPAVDQPLFIEALVRNHGETTVLNADIQLVVDEQRVMVRTVDVLPPATSTTVRFAHTFETAGEHVVTAQTEQTELADALQDDNRSDTVVSVVPYVAVLLVNGNAFAHPGDQSATFLQLALDPISRTHVAEPQQPIGQSTRPIRVTRINASALPDVASLADYDVIILSEVPRLPADVAAEISTYVVDGGGLWIIPDQHANTAFYNSWTAKDSNTTLLPATLLDYQRSAEPGIDAAAVEVGIDLQAVTAGFVRDLINTGEHDLTEVQVSGYREVDVPETAVAGMNLTSGSPLFVEHSAGQGRVLLQTVPLGRRECNLPQRVCFPVLMHVWSYYLANGQAHDANFEPAPELSVPVAAGDGAGISGAGNVGDSLLMVDPAGHEQAVSVVQHSQGRVATVRPAGRPGVYTLRPPDTPEASLRFTVARDADESDLAAISAEALQARPSTRAIQWLDDVTPLRMAGVRDVGEFDISPFLLLAVLCLIAVESLLAATIRQRRAVTAPTRSTAATLPAFSRSNPDHSVSGSVSDSVRDSVGHSGQTKVRVSASAGGAA